MSRALVVGAAGFIGRHLADALVVAGWSVAGAGRSDAPSAWPHDWIRCDLLDAARLREAVSGARPDVVFHAAGSPLEKFDRLLSLNVAGTQGLLDAITASGRAARVVVVGSASEYGSVGAQRLPVDESHALRPVSLYGVAKAAQTLVALRPGNDATVGRVFNVSGPGEPRSLVGGAFAAQIAELERGGAGGEIAVGDLSADRDFVDVRDAARALVALAERGAPGEVYNVCSGVSTPIRDVVATLIAVAEVPVEARLDPDRAVRPHVPRMVGSPTKVRSATGWSPTISLEQTLADVLASYRTDPTL
jgi:GDP-4-dehydro-6-deoxy-D-mannose reductase